jgi:hypothetical protein
MKVPTMKVDPHTRDTLLAMEKLQVEIAKAVGVPKEMLKQYEEGIRFRQSLEDARREFTVRCNEVFARMLYPPKS